MFLLPNPLLNAYKQGMQDLSPAVTASQAQTPLVTVAIVNYGAGEMLERCVEALLAQEMASFTAYVVDNPHETHGHDPALERLPADPRLTIIRNPTNTGYGAANNQVLLEATTPYVVTLNPDVVAQPHWLGALVNAAQRSPEVAMFASRQLWARDPSRLDGLGDELSLFGLCWRIGNGVPEDDWLARGTLFSPCAAAALYRTDAYQRAGGFCPEFFCYCEDVDLGYRLRLSGETCALAYDAVALHHGYGCTAERSHIMLVNSICNLIWMYVRCTPLPIMVLALGMLLTCVALTITAFGMLFSALPALLAALLSVAVLIAVGVPLASTVCKLWDIREVIAEGLSRARAGMPWCLRERRRIQQGVRTREILNVARAMNWNPLAPLFWRLRVAQRRRVRRMANTKC